MLRQRDPALLPRKYVLPERHDLLSSRWRGEPVLPTESGLRRRFGRLCVVMSERIRQLWRNVLCRQLLLYQPEYVRPDLLRLGHDVQHDHRAVRELSDDAVQRRVLRGRSDLLSLVKRARLLLHWDVVLRQRLLRGQSILL